MIANFKYYFMEIINDNVESSSYQPYCSPLLDISLTKARINHDILKARKLEAIEADPYVRHL